MTDLLPEAGGTAPASRPRQPRVPPRPGILGAATVLLVLLVAIPSKLIFAPLGGAGAPSGIFGMLLFLYWLLTKIITPTRGRMMTPIHIAAIGFAGSILISYLIAATRPITGTEISSADRGVLSMIGWLGMMLAIADGVRSLNELNRLLRRLVVAGGLLGALGLVQFATKQTLTNYIVIPGLSGNTDLTAVISRDGFSRPAGTAIHPIEFGAVITMILPVALHYALHDTSRRALARWWPALAMAAAIPVSISRSAILSAAVGLLIILPTWSPQQRRRAYLAIVGLLGVFYLFVHGLLSTITHLFTGISSDSSAGSRSGSFAIAWQMFQREPAFGRGFNTFGAAYRIFDNSYLGVLVGTGAVGLLATLWLLGSGVWSGVAARRIGRSPAQRSLSLAMAASIAAAACSIALYDQFGFTMATGVLFVLLGCLAANFRIIHRLQSR